MSVASAISDGVDSDDRHWRAGCDGDVEQVSEGLVPSGVQFLLGLAAVFAELIYLGLSRNRPFHEAGRLLLQVYSDPSNRRRVACHPRFFHQAGQPAGYCCSASFGRVCDWASGRGFFSSYYLYPVKPTPLSGLRHAGSCSHPQGSPPRQ